MEVNVEAGAIAVKVEASDEGPPVASRSRRKQANPKRREPTVLPIQDEPEA